MQSASRTVNMPRGYPGARVRIDASALGPLFDRHQPALWGLAVRMLGDPDRAHDLVHDALLRALGRELPDDHDRARAWLMRTLVNLCRDLHRRRKVRRVQEDRVVEFETDRSGTRNPEAAAVAKATLDRAIRRLPPRRRAVLVLRELDGMGVREIARALGMAQPTVRWHLARAKRDLKNHLDPESDR